MRLNRYIVLGLALLLTGCALPKPEANPDKYVDYRSTSDLQDKRAALEVITAPYVRKGPPNKMTNRQELGTLADEIAAGQLRELDQINREMAKRYKQGDKKAYYEGIEKVPNP